MPTILIHPISPRCGAPHSPARKLAHPHVLPRASPSPQPTNSMFLAPSALPPRSPSARTSQPAMPSMTSSNNPDATRVYVLVVSARPLSSASVLLYHSFITTTADAARPSHISAIQPAQLYRVLCRFSYEPEASLSWRRVRNLRSCNTIPFIPTAAQARSASAPRSYLTQS